MIRHLKERLNFCSRLITLLSLLGVFSARIQAGENLLEIPDVETSPGVVTKIPVNLRNQDPVTAVELTIKCTNNGWWPNYADIIPGDRLTESHTASYNVLSNSVKILVYSPSNAPLGGSAGTLCEIPIQVSSSNPEGSSYPFEIIDCLLVRPDGEEISASYSAGSLIIKETPDLVPSDIAISQTSITPDGMIDISWTVKNIGTHATYSGFRETLELVDSRNQISFLGERHYDEIIATGASVARESSFRIPATPGIDGNVRVRVTLYPYSDCGESVNGRANNTGESATEAYLANIIRLSFPNIIIEGSGETYCSVTRSGSTDTPLSVKLSPSPADSRFSIPETVTIRQWNHSESFPVSLKSNQDYEGERDITVTASAQGLADASATIHCIDNVQPTLTLTEEADDIEEGKKLRFTLSRNIISDSDVEVKIDCERRRQFRFPSTVTIPAGSLETDFELEAIDDNAMSLPVSVMVQASAQGYESGKTYIRLLDNDMPDISLKLTPSTVAEDAGPAGVLATVRRVSGSNGPLRLRISTDRNSDIYFESPVIDMPENETELTFPVGIVDNADAEGDREVAVNVAVYSSDCGCWASETQKGFVESRFTLTDNDGPALSLSAPAAVAEGKDVQVTVRRNSGTKSPLTVTLSSESDKGMNPSFPQTVTIPSGSSETGFTLSVPANETQGDSSIISIFAAGEGHSTGSCRIMVSDSTLPDAVITGLTTVTETFSPSDEMTLRITVANEGSATLPAKTPVAINIDGNATATAYTLGSISPGASETLSKSVIVPASTGRHTVSVKVNPDNTVHELQSANNSGTPLVIDVTADVKGELNLDGETFVPGVTVGFSGKVTGGIRPGGEVDVIFTNAGLRTPLRVKVAADGTFSGEFTPYSSRTGLYTAGLAYPGDTECETLASFNLLALKSGSIFGKEEIDEGESFTHTADFTNLCSVPLTSIVVTCGGPLPEGIRSIDFPKSLAPGETGTLTVLSDPLAATAGTDWLKLPVRITSAEGLVSDYTLYYYAHSLRGEMNLSATNVSTTMTVGAERIYTLTLTNGSKAPTGEISVYMPSADWLSLVGPSTIPSLAGGESHDITFRLSPTPGMQLNNPVSATVAINADRADGKTVTFKAEPVSEATGTLLIEACDEYTYNTAEAPHVSGATVTVMHPATRKVLHTLTTDTDGLASVEIPEGYYYVSVTEPKHSGFEGMLLVDPGKTTRKVVNLGVEGVSIDIRYEQTEVEDVYEIVTNVKYETNVPVPVVEAILPERIDIESLQPGESLLFNAVLTNKGLITAQNTSLQLPEYDDPEYTFETLEANSFDLRAGESKVIPVLVSRAGAEPGGQDRAVRKAPAKKGSCHMSTIVYYESYCGPDKKIHIHRHEIQVKVCNGGGSPSGPVRPGSVPSLPYIPGGGGIGGPTSPGTSAPTKATSEKSKADEWVDKFESFVCDPCTHNFINAGAKCNNFDPNHPIQSIIKRFPVIGDIAGCGFSMANCMKDNGSFWRKCGGDLAGCAFMLCEKLGGSLVSYGTATAGTGYGAAVAGVGKITEVTCKFLGKGKDLLDCGKGLKDACKKNNGNKAPALHDDAPEDDYHSLYPSYINQYIEKLDHVIDGRQAIHEYYEEIIGSEEFADATSAEMAALFDAINLYDDEALLDADALLPFAPECVSEEGFRAFIKRQNNSTLKIAGKPFEGESIDFERLKALSETIQATVDYTHSLGYESVVQMITDSYIEMQEGYNDKSGSVCSSVTLALEQRMTMTRQAIRGTLTVINGHESATLSDFKTYLNIYDENGELVGSDRLQTAVEGLEGFTGKQELDAGWELPHSSEGVARILFIPTPKAAPEKTVEYTFKGEVTYLDPFSGLEVTRTLTPATLEIYPSPELHLTYFMQRDVMGDDPLTANVIESSVPSEFALVVANRGKGDASSVSLTTAQPRIVDNEKGLALDMRIVESRLNGESSAIVPDERVSNDFGDIPSGTTAWAQWMIESNLMGHFTDYDVDVTHASSYGNPDLSLIDGAEIHELILGMTLPAENGESKNVRAFVANDIEDITDTPDRIYFSDGRADLPVFEPSDAALDVDGLTGTLRLTPATAGWQYFAIDDPTYGMLELTGAVRESDDAEIPTDNFRQTDRTLRDGHEPIYEYRLQGALYASGAETYRLTFAEREQTPVEVVEWTGIPAEGTLATEAVKEVAVRFNSVMDPATVTPDVVKIIFQGVTVPTDAVTITPSESDASLFTLSLGERAAGNGYYQLMVDLSKVRDSQGLRGTGWARCGWVMMADGKVDVSVEVSPEGAGKVSGIPTSIEAGSKVNLTAKSANGYTFQAWILGDEIIGGEPHLEVTADNDMKLTAIFSPVSHTVAVSLSDELAGTLSGALSGTYPHGSDITLTVEPASGWNFTGWVLSDGKVIGTETTLTVAVESDMELTARLEKAAQTATASHTHPLNAGWNWISFPVNNRSLFANPAGILTGLKGSATELRAESASLKAGDSGEWNGNIENVSHLDGYRLLSNSAASFKLNGETFSDTELTMTLNAGSNLVGAPLRRPTAVGEALSGMAASEGDAVMGHDAIALFNGSDWIGSLTELLPGDSYVIQSAERVTFNWPVQNDAESFTPAVAARECQTYSVDPSGYPDNMGFVIRLEGEDAENKPADFAVMALDAVSGECLGIAEGHDGLYFMTAHGDATEERQLKLVVLNTQTGETLEDADMPAVSFAANAVRGSIAAPVLLNIGITVGVDTLGDRVEIYPNPVKETLNIQGLEDNEAEVTVIDMEGRLRLRHHGLERHTALDLSQLASGLYRLILRTSGSTIVKPLLKQ